MLLCVSWLQVIIRESSAHMMLTHSFLEEHVSCHLNFSRKTQSLGDGMWKEPDTDRFCTFVLKWGDMLVCHRVGQRIRVGSHEHLTGVGSEQIHTVLGRGVRSSMQSCQWMETCFHFFWLTNSKYFLNFVLRLYRKLTFVFFASFVSSSVLAYILMLTETNLSKEYQVIFPRCKHVGSH